MERKYDVLIKEKAGSCDNSLFEKMAKKGDLTATKLAEVIGKEITIKGFAKVHIVTDSKEFDVYYFDTEEYGLISSGSEIFANSVKDYFGEVEKVIIKEVKTKQGKTYKAVPVLNTKKEVKTEDTVSDELPF